MKFKKVRGYISSRDINSNFISHKIQNLVIRDFCNNCNLRYLLSSVEHKMKNSYFVLNMVLNEINKIDGIVMYSIFQLPKNERERIKIFNVMIKKKKILCFALENIILKNEKDALDANNLYKLNHLIKFCPQEINGY